jgi:hypothetical protein
MTDPQWVETLNEWLIWARTQVDPKTDLGQFGFQRRVDVADWRAARYVPGKLMKLGLLKKAEGWLSSKPYWWVAPEGTVTLESYLSSKDNPAPTSTHQTTTKPPLRRRAISHQDWLKTLNEWLEWCRSQTDPATDIGSFSFSTRYKAADWRRGPRVCKMLQDLGFVKKAKGYIDAKPKWWVDPIGEITLERFMLYIENPPPKNTRIETLQAKEARLLAELETTRGAMKLLRLREQGPKDD